MYAGKFAFQNWLVGLACSGKEIYHFTLFYFVFEGKFKVQAPGGLILERRFNGGFFALRFWGAYFRNFTVFSIDTIQTQITEKR